MNQLEDQRKVKTSESTSNQIIFDIEMSRFCEEKPKKKLIKFYKIFILKIRSQLGCLLAILSAFTFSLGGIFYIKAISMSGSDNSIFRFIIQFISMTVLLKYKNIPILGPREQRKLLITRSFFGIFAVLLANFSIKYIDISDSSAISHTSVVVTAILAKIFLKEKFGIQHLLALLLAIIGVTLMTKPTFIFRKQNDSLNDSFYNLTNDDNLTILNDSCLVERRFTKLDINDRLIGISFALAGAISTGAIHVVIKWLCINKIHFGVSTIYGIFLGLPASIITSTVLVVTGANHSNFKCELGHLLFDIIFGLIGGSISVLAIVLLNVSLNFEDATKVAIVRTTGIKFIHIIII